MPAPRARSTESGRLRSRRSLRSPSSASERRRSTSSQSWKCRWTSPPRPGEVASQHPERMGCRQLEQLGTAREAAAAAAPAAARAEPPPRGSSGETSSTSSRRTRAPPEPRQPARRDTSRRRRSIGARGRVRAATPPRRARRQRRPRHPGAVPGSVRPSACGARVAPGAPPAVRARARACSSSPASAFGGLSRAVTTNPAGRRSRRRSKARQTASSSGRST